jgi:hypothetical protein
LIENGVKITLGEAFQGLGISLDNFTLDSLDVKAVNTFKRFDKFKAKYNPLGRTEMRSVSF